MADLLDLDRLAVWTQNDPAVVASDPFAEDVVFIVSEMAKFLGGHPDWTLEAGENLAPFDVQLVVLQVCKRAYENPGQVVQEGVGPLNERKLDAAALLLDLTETERNTLTRYNPDGDPTGGVGGVWVQPTTVGDETTLKTPTLYVGDNQQVNLGSQREWKIPMFNPGDPGGDLSEAEE